MFIFFMFHQSPGGIQTISARQQQLKQIQYSQKNSYFSLKICFLQKPEAQRQLQHLYSKKKQLSECATGLGRVSNTLLITLNILITSQMGDGRPADYIATLTYNWSSHSLWYHNIYIYIYVTYTRQEECHAIIVEAYSSQFVWQRSRLPKRNFVALDFLPLGN